MVKAASLAALVAAFLSVASAAPVQTNDTITDAVDAPDAAAVYAIGSFLPIHVLLVNQTLIVD